MSGADVKIGRDTGTGDIVIEIAAVQGTGIWRGTVIGRGIAIIATVIETATARLVTALSVACRRDAKTLKRRKLPFRKNPLPRRLRLWTRRRWKRRPCSCC